jgi:hypothetical protein
MYPCPSIAELLDAIRIDRRSVALKGLPKEVFDTKTLADYLAEFWLYDKEN